MRILFFSIRLNLYISQKSRKPHGQGRNIRYHQKNNKNRCKICQQRPDYLLDLRLSHLYADKQGRSHRRSDGSNTQVKDNHDTKVNGIHSQRLTNRKENRCKNQTGRSHVHKGSHNQQKNVNNEENHISIVADSQHCLRHRSRNTCKCHYPAHNTGNANQENNNTCHLCTVQKDFRQLRRLDRFVKEH